ncbi:hypothetical protein [Microcoleus vaginatus]
MSLSYMKEGSAATDYVRDVTDITDVRKKEVRQRAMYGMSGRRKKVHDFS